MPSGGPRPLRVSRPHVSRRTAVPRRPGHRTPTRTETVAYRVSTAALQGAGWSHRVHGARCGTQRPPSPGTRQPTSLQGLAAYTVYTINSTLPPCLGPSHHVHDHPNVCSSRQRPTSARPGLKIQDFCILICGCLLFIARNSYPQYSCSLLASKNTRAADRIARMGPRSTLGFDPRTRCFAENENYRIDQASASVGLAAVQKCIIECHCITKY